MLFQVNIRCMVESLRHFFRNSYETRDYTKTVLIYYCLDSDELFKAIIQRNQFLQQWNFRGSPLVLLWVVPEESVGPLPRALVLVLVVWPGFCSLTGSGLLGESLLPEAHPQNAGVDKMVSLFWIMLILETLWGLMGVLSSVKGTQRLSDELDPGKVNCVCTLNTPLPVLDVNHKHVKHAKHVAIVLKGTINSSLSILHRLGLLFL